MSALASPDPGSPSDVICDIAYLDAVRKWADSGTHAGYLRRTFVLVTSEERRQYHQRLGPPLTGYLLKPFRRQSLLRVLTSGDRLAVASAVNMLRTIAGVEARSAAADVLLAEDNPVNALLARTMLERAGYRVHHAVNGAQALEFLESGLRPVMIVMDVEMPVLNGLEATRRIREKEAASGGDHHVPILALTANAGRNDIRECLDAGMDGHLSKPFDREDLDEAIGNLIQNRPAA